MVFGEDSQASGFRAEGDGEFFDLVDQGGGEGDGLVFGVFVVVGVIELDPEVFVGVEAGVGGDYGIIYGADEVAVVVGVNVGVGPADVGGGVLPPGGEDVLVDGGDFNPD